MKGRILKKKPLSMVEQYERQRRNERALSMVDLKHAGSVTKTGCLWKQGQTKLRQWNERLFVLSSSPGSLNYYDPKGGKLKKRFPLVSAGGTAAAVRVLPHAASERASRRTRTDRS